MVLEFVQLFSLKAALFDVGGAIIPKATKIFPKKLMDAT
jgi:hypothetical protein